MIRVIIVDDETYSLKWLETLLRQIPEFEIAGMFTNPLEALERIPVIEADALLVDIEMPLMNGVELAAKVKGTGLQTVFVTGHAQFAVDAYRLEVSDYLMKPITKEMLEGLLKRLKRLKPIFTSSYIEEKASQPSISNSLMKITCFGVFQTETGSGEMVKWPTRKTEELFAYLLTKRNSVVNRWVLADLLWPEQIGQRSMHNLYNAIYRLRKTAEQYALPLTIELINDGYKLSLGPNVYCDVCMFLDTLDNVHTLKERMAHVQTIHRGSLFDDKDYAWAADIRAMFDVYYDDQIDLK